MATKNTSCIVCFTDKEDVLLCDECNNTSCLECIKTYKKLECPECRTCYSDSILKDWFDDNKELYINYYVYKNLKFNDQTNSLLISYFKEAELKKIIFSGDISKIQGIVKRGDRLLKCLDCNNIIIGESICRYCIEKKKSELGIDKQLLTCKNCSGIIIETGKCISCGYKICTKCEDPYHGETECDPEVLKSLMKIKETCKKCPSCFTYINKTEGCSHMNCTYCGASFDWTNPETIQEDKYTYKPVSGKFINKDLNNRYKEIYDEFFSKEKKSNLNYLDLNDYKLNRNDIKLTKIKDCCSEDIKEFALKINLDFKKNQNILKKISTQYFTLLKQQFEKTHGEILTQLEMTYLLDRKLIQELYNRLKKQEYYLKINKEMTKDDYELNLQNLGSSLRKIDLSMIIPEEYKFFIDNSKIVTNKTQSQKIKIKNDTIIKGSSKNNKGIQLLDEDQKVHAENVYKILEKFGSCLNTSHAGSGKTYTSLYVANKLKIKQLILFFPKIIQKKWISIIETYNSQYNFNVINFTYSEISSQSFKNNNNIYTRKIEKDKIIITLSEEFVKKINKDTLVIFDEVHNVKSPSSLAFKFIQTVATTIKQNKGYLLALSATPVENFKEIMLLNKKLDFIDKFAPVALPWDSLSFYNRELEKNISDREVPLLDSSEKMFIGIILPKKYSKAYEDIMTNLNLPTMRNKKQNLISIIKNFITNGIDLDFILRQIVEESRYNKYLERITVKDNIIEYINSQSYEEYFVLVNNYAIYMLYAEERTVLSIDPRIKIPNFNTLYMVPLILYLYGINMRTAVQISLLYTTDELIDTLNTEFFNMKTFNISTYLDKKYRTSIPKLKLLEIILSEDDNHILRTAFEQVLVNIDNNISVATLQTFALITKGLMLSEIIYVPYIIEIISKIYKNKRKIVIGMHYIETMKKIKEELDKREIDYIYIDGSVKDKNKVIDDFQLRDNNILLVNIKSMNSGIDLDDKVGNSPRTVFIIPDFKFSETIQFMYRFKRIDSKSEPNIYLLNNHTRILSNLFSKNKSIKNLNTSIPDLNDIPKINQHEIE